MVRVQRDAPDAPYPLERMGSCISGKYFVGYKIYISLYWLHGNVLQNCLYSVKLGVMMFNNQILSCLIYWSSFISRHEQLIISEKSLYCACAFSMFVAIGTKIRMFTITCHLVDWSTSFNIVVLGDRCCKTILWSIRSCCCSRWLQLAVFPCNQSVFFTFQEFF